MHAPYSGLFWIDFSSGNPGTYKPMVSVFSALNTSGDALVCGARLGSSTEFYAESLDPLIIVFDSDVLTLNQTSSETCTSLPEQLLIDRGEIFFSIEAIPFGVGRLDSLHYPEEIPSPPDAVITTLGTHIVPLNPANRFISFEYGTNPNGRDVILTFVAPLTISNLLLGVTADFPVTVEF